jgi:CelD/BcsL family acetyltransferase involved in cellulose biosynthesis
VINVPNSVSLFTTDPLSDPRWATFVAAHPKASVFHQPGWLHALKKTYGYEPLVLTSAQPGQPLQDGLVFCRVASWLTGKRFVSLPFADHCEPLVDESEQPVFAAWLQAQAELEKLDYFELRPLSPFRHSAQDWREAQYWFHRIDLAPRLDEIFASLHKNCIQRKARKAEKEGLELVAGTTEDLIDDFFRLLLRTRRRHSLPPQPRAWFANLLAAMGENAEVRVARKGKLPIAAMIVLRHRATTVYKYGCSDERYHALGAMPFLFWKLIEDAKHRGMTEIDLGRSDMDNEGLAIFKDRLGATRRTLTYHRYSRVPDKPSAQGWKSHIQSAVGIVPDSLLKAAGTFFYRHLG